MEPFNPVDMDQRIKDGENFQGWAWSVHRGSHNSDNICGSPDHGINLQAFPQSSIVSLLNYISSGAINPQDLLKRPDTFWKDVEFKCDWHGDIQSRSEDEDWADVPPGELIYAILDMQLTIHRLQKVIDEHNSR